MSSGPDYDRYAAKMRQHLADGVDLAVDARFVDMLANRGSRILDIGCGPGTAVAALRARGHVAYGVDPTPVVLDIARERFDPGWYAEIDAESLSAGTLGAAGFPSRFDVVLMAGNVPAFLGPAAFSQTFVGCTELLSPGGLLVIGTTASAQGGPAHQDRHALECGFTLLHRASDWHLSPFDPDSDWSVSVFTAPGERTKGPGPDGVFILDPATAS